MSAYIELLDHIEDLTDSEKRILIGLTTYLKEEQLAEFEKYNADLGISIRQSLFLPNIEIQNEKIKQILDLLKKYI